ncbi:MAG TPA: peptidase [Alteromonas australica]|uniref:Peptidase n=1 Tax=Alteromonas australica TaxID=589873 RepID=A0A358DWZ2_9ALTE|nr:PepSY-associated TM helix domain-containing protein [Alteromonas australica]MBU33689.1 peptidase [Alteromonas sp.]HAW76160.1 peptidase [Alteromonas australica]HBU50697.1 peptidase [Alteromonas australica]|tara:strand:- start:50 stop:1513 length:1464 start_codon:yes stop_codon:yes gene_type:complete
MDKTTKQNALNAHNWVGVFLSVLLFLVCLSGTVAVFHLEFERWEQPHIQEMDNVSPQVIEKAMDTFLAQNPEESHHLYVVFPTSDIPRLVVENDHKAYFADQEGNLLEEESVSFTQMLVDLHLYLNLPQSWGMILVSALGAIICTLVITGIIAHKRMSKDAFKLRRGGNGQQAQIDLHNRFGLWAAPFHLVIGITGAYFGMAGIILVTVATLNYNGDRDAVVNQIFTPDPVLAPQEGKPAIGKAFAQMETLAPEKSPIFLTVHEVGEPEQFIEIYAKAPNRMIYAEGYRFDTAGNFVGVAGYEFGEWGKQLVWAMYRLHFGDFAGMTSKWLYFVLGVMLTMLCVSGMEVWLSKKAHPPLASRLWYSVVWGSVSALALTAIADMFISGSLIAVFWCVMAVNTVLTVVFKRMTKPVWLLISGFSVLLLLTLYVVVHGEASLNVASLQLNIPMLAYVVWSVLRANTLLKREGMQNDINLQPSSPARETTA